MNLSIERIGYLLNELKKLPSLPYHHQTFMEIAGYPHFENVCSNILRFYIQPRNEHGFNTLFLDAIARSINQNFSVDEQDIYVKREVLTGNNNRIDLVIEADDFVIGIENKIFAQVQNDLEDYWNYLSLVGEGRSTYAILLTLRPIQPSNKLHNFHPVVYETLFSEVLSAFDSCLSTANKSHVIFFRDFVQTIQNLQKTTTMDQHRLDFFLKNRSDIENLLSEINLLRDDIQRKVKQVKEIVESEMIVSCYPIKQDTWMPPTDLVAAVFYEITLSDSLTLQFDVLLSLRGWHMQFFNKRGKRQEIEQWVKRRGFQVEATTQPRWRLVEIGKLPYETEPEIIRDRTLNTLRKLVAP